MKTYCVKCRKDTGNIDPKMVRTKNNKLIMQSKYPVCGTKKSRFVKEQEAKVYWEIWELKHLWVKFHCYMFCFKCKNELNCE